MGTVIDIENPPDERRGADQSGVSRYRFRVNENFNGVDEEQLDIYSGRGGGDCSVHFQMGDTYLVDAYPDGGRFFVSACSETQGVANAEPLLSELRARRDRKPYASLFGVLRRTQQPYGWTAYDDYDRPLPNTRVTIVGANHTLTTQTDKGGVFRFYDVPADTYHFEAGLSGNLVLGETILGDSTPPVTLPEQACFHEDLDALPTGRIHGRVLGPDGVPLKNADVALFRADRYSETEMGWWEYQDEKTGYFEFNHVAPGKYVVVFHNSNRKDPDIPFPRAFYPGVPDLKSALPITLGDGEQFMTADIHVFGGSATRVLTVRVKWAKKPTPDDVFVIVESSEGDAPLAERVSPGVFHLTMLTTARYTIHATQDCGLRWEGNMGIPIGERVTESVDVEGSDTATPEITLEFKDSKCKPYSPPNP